MGRSQSRGEENRAGAGDAGLRTSLNRALCTRSWLALVVGWTLAWPALGAAQEEAPPSRESLEEAVREAEAAADAAWVAARAAERRTSGPTWGQSRGSGFYLGAGFLYAAEDFEETIIVKSSLGGSVVAGYRTRSFFAAELRYEGFDGFELKGSNGRGEIDGYAVTLNAKLYPISGPIEPFVGVGLGGMSLKAKAILNSGLRGSDRASDVLARVAGGFDLPVNHHLALTFEAAYLVPFDDLRDLEITTLTGGLTFMF